MEPKFKILSNNEKLQLPPPPNQSSSSPSALFDEAGLFWRVDWLLVSLEPNQSSSAFESFLGAVGAGFGADSFGCSLNQSSLAGAGFSGTFLGFSLV